MTHDEKMLKRAKENLERIRREYTGDMLKFFEPSAMHLVAAYEKRVQEGRRPSMRPNHPSGAGAGKGNCYEVT